MMLALYIFLAIVAVGVVLKLTDRPRPQETSSESAPDISPTQNGGDECCGMHITCEKDSLLTAMADKIEYYEDEELDRFAGRRVNEYTEAETDEFRDVLLTLRPEEIAGWARSIQLRGIELPEPVRDELLMIVSEARAALHTSDA